MKNLNLPKLNKQINMSKSESDLFSKIDVQHLNDNKQVKKEKTIQSNEENIERQKLLKTFLKESLDSLDTPSTKAFIKIVLSRHILLKVFYVSFLLASTGFASYLVIQSIMNYLTYDVTTKSRIVYETPTLFPKVTICNLNKYATEFAFDLLQMNNFDTSLSLEQKKKLGRNLNEILISCYFNDNQCNTTDFVWSFDENFGNCFTFNSGGLDFNGNKVYTKESTLAGLDYGLQLWFYVNVNEKMLEQISQMGAVIRIGNSSYSTFYSSGEGIFLSPGFRTNIAVDREFKSILPKPYSNCKIDSNSPQFIQGLDLYNSISPTNYKYTQQLCFNECYQKFIFQRFNCTDSNYFSLLNESKCSHDLSDSILDMGYVFGSEFINKNCLSACPLECEQIFYMNSISFSQINEYNQFLNQFDSNSNLKSDLINRNFKKEIKNSFVQVNVFYDSLSYTLTTESPQWDAITLFGSIGGNLGLFLGGSVFSLCELIEVAAEFYFIFTQRKVTNGD